jgi:hypothetical protein
MKNTDPRTNRGSCPIITDEPADRGHRGPDSGRPGNGAKAQHLMKASLHKTNHMKTRQACTRLAMRKEGKPAQSSLRLEN